ncbi:protein of unknown function [Desulfonispora thiosulfatigenes DSM 11270]|uniref:DUF2935 domain-containing protein n=1 Tax=Desulfonispora thiosulfatigenes DSM 11270 TaxID=656914 RepID=A0A1W1VJL8_DESTI|nr:DUF2935 domain-containing protein [Desulfonispora thiosulfatigenes]SMB93251.1 protein of unknown function [Desulfonispora thiosulfatigenes DSM 11270]
MLSRERYIQKSLETNLFFARIMKDHALFLALGFTPKDANLMQMALQFKSSYSILLTRVTSLSNGLISKNVLESGEIVTEYTLLAEQMTQDYTGVPINTNITKAQLDLMGGTPGYINPMLDQQVFMLNQEAINLTTSFIQFKSKVLFDVLECRLFTRNYPLMIDHLIEEANFYVEILRSLQNYQNAYKKKDAKVLALFWNDIMSEHAKFMRGMFDPTEKDLIEKANYFAHEFEELVEESQEDDYLIESLEETREIIKFKTSGLEGLLSCKIKSIIVPLLGDHVLREANHYLRVLKEEKKGR